MARPHSGTLDPPGRAREETVEEDDPQDSLGQDFSLLGGGGDSDSRCSGDLSPPSDSFEYKLKGEQVEPTAGFWLTRNSITVPRRDDVIEYAEGRKAKPRWQLQPEDFPTEERLPDQLAILRALARDRGVHPYRAGRTYSAGEESLTLTPLSRFLQLHPPPFGAVFDVEAHPTQGIGTGQVNRQHELIFERRKFVDQGQELARLFEQETPGLLHRHALNWLFFNRADVSPTRQARVWLALDMAIYTALDAAWYYKWSDPRYSRLSRPSEYAARCTNQRLNVLYDSVVDDNGREERPAPRPGDKPGTPRHSAWPSGHSTYSAAASYILEYFFSPDTLMRDDEDVYSTSPPESTDVTKPVWVAAELRRMASNIGEARLWAGVHWLSDHVAGQKIGRAAAAAVAERFLDDCIVPFTAPPMMAPVGREELDALAAASRECPPGDEEGRRHDEITPRPGRGVDFLKSRSPT